MISWSSHQATKATGTRSKEQRNYWTTPYPMFVQFMTMNIHKRQEDWVRDLKGERPSLPNPCCQLSVQGLHKRYSTSGRMNGGIRNCQWTLNMSRQVMSCLVFPSIVRVWRELPKNTTLMSLSRTTWWRLQKIKLSSKTLKPNKKLKNPMIFFILSLPWVHIHSSSNLDWQMKLDMSMLISIHSGTISTPTFGPWETAQAFLAQRQLRQSFLRPQCSWSTFLFNLK